MSQSLVSYGNQIQETATHYDPEKGIEPCYPSGEERKRDPPYDAAQRKYIGNRVCVEIDERDENQEGNEHELDQELEVQSMQPKEHNREKPRDCLHDRIAEGNRRLAEAAFSPQKQEAYEGNIIVESDRTVTLRAMGSRSYNRFTGRQPMDDDV